MNRMRKPSMLTHAQIESALRAQADAARAVPSPALRRTTLAALAETDRISEPVRAWGRRWLGSALVAVIVMVVAGALAISLSHDDEQPAAGGTVGADERLAWRPSGLDNVARVGARSVRQMGADIESPLQREAMLLAHDTRAVLANFRDSLPRPLRIESTPTEGARQ